jgi:enterochelin esterase family protein
MKKLLPLVVSLLTLPLLTLSHAQSAAGRYVDEAKDVTFKLRAPQAKTVVVRAQWTREPLQLTRVGEKGDWSLVVPKGNIPPGVWEYSYEVDGMTIIDPNNPTVKPQRQPNTSLLSVPSTPPAPWDWQDVPHGVLHTHEYFSTALGKPRELVVYTPPGYNPANTYPLLVLQHGWGDNQRVWIVQGKMNLILDNLIAEKKVVPMVVMMMNGHPLPQEPKAGPGVEMQAFTNELYNDALPLVESSYRVDPSGARRAFAGLSMGGEQALGAALIKAPEKFAWIGAFSAEIPKGDIPAKLADIALKSGPQLKLLWIQTGKDDAPKLKQNQDFVALLKDKGVNFHWKLTEGDHSWPIWRGYLVEFLPLIFRDPGT